MTDGFNGEDLMTFTVFTFYVAFECSVENCVIICINAKSRLVGVRVAFHESFEQFSGTRQCEGHRKGIHPPPRRFT